MYVKVCQMFDKSCVSKVGGLLCWSSQISGRLCGSRHISGRLCESRHSGRLPVCKILRIHRIPVRYGYSFFSIRCLHQKWLNTDYRNICQLYSVTFISVKKFSTTSCHCKESGSESDKVLDDESETHTQKLEHNAEVNLYTVDGKFIVKISKTKAKQMAAQKDAELVPFQQLNHRRAKFMSFKLVPKSEESAKKSKSKSGEVIIEITPFIMDSDLETKMRKIESILRKGKVVKVRFYRNMRHRKDRDFEMEKKAAYRLYNKIKTFLDDTGDIGRISNPETDTVDFKLFATITPYLKNEVKSEE